LFKLIKYVAYFQMERHS